MTNLDTMTQRPRIYTKRPMEPTTPPGDRRWSPPLQRTLRRQRRGLAAPTRALRPPCPSRSVFPDTLAAGPVEETTGYCMAIHYFHNVAINSNTSFK